jgi:hypothetical protein
MRPGAKKALPAIGKNRSKLNLEVTNNVSQINKKRKIHYKNTLILPLRLDRMLWHSDFAEEFQPDRILSTVKNIKEQIKQMKSKEENYKLFNIILTRKRRKGRVPLRRLVRQLPILIN